MTNEPRKLSRRWPLAVAAVDGLQAGCAVALTVIAACDGPPIIALLGVPGMLVAGVAFARSVGEARRRWRD